MTEPNKVQLTGGLCTWALQKPSGGYVGEPGNIMAATVDLDHAHVWFSQESADQIARDTPWLSGSQSKRARP